ncbi:hypothetical protein ACFUGD_01295 [Streptomyces sp. NPDC057217]|uniref:hypothetical protein n=1 Tax=Streptomyces sp. NPDC057217 TaxID=3346054 RepID=UPI003624D118
MTECGSGPTIEEENAAYERDREERVETYYSGWGARDMAERIVELEDELGSDVDGVCTGMHADVAEAHSEIDRLTSLVGYWEHRAEESDRLREHAGSLYEMFKRLRDDEADRADRFESAWKSARRRAKTAVGAWRYTQWRVDQHDEERRKDGEFQRFLWGQLHERSAGLRRYRLAWLSARRRAADEANMATEALDFLRDRHEVELQRLRAPLDEER